MKDTDRTMHLQRGEAVAYQSTASLGCGILVPDPRIDPHVGDILWRGTTKFEVTEVNLDYIDPRNSTVRYWNPLSDIEERLTIDEWRTKTANLEVRFMAARAPLRQDTESAYVLQVK